VLRIMRAVKPDTKVNVRVRRDGVTRDFTVTARRGPAVFLAAHGLPDVDFGWLPQLPGALMIHGPIADLELATLTPRLGSYFGADRGVLVVRAPADGALQLEDGDVILAIDGREPDSGSHATRILASYQPGEKLTLRVMRQHKTQELQATLPANAGHGQRDLLWREAAPQVAPPAKVLIPGHDEV
jgi:PDZ domain